MKKLSAILFGSAALVLAGCDNNKGGSSAESSTNYHGITLTNNYKGGALSPDSINTGAGSSTNSPAADTNDQGAAVSPRTLDGGGQPIDPNSTNAVPEK
jgi:hypothetical protein